MPTIQARARGVATLALGVLVVLAPFVAGYWAAGLIGIGLLIGAILELAQVLRSPDRRSATSSYVVAIGSLLAAFVLLTRPEMVVGGLMTVVAVLFVVQGVASFWSALGRDARYRVGPVLAGVLDLVAALLLWRSSTGVAVALLGVAVGIHLLGAGWKLLLAPAGSGDGAPAISAPPGLESDVAYARARDAVRRHQRQRLPADVGWLATFAVVFLAIHVGRMKVSWTFIGLISPLVATAGDLVTAVLLAVLALPVRLGWRRLTRSMEASAWGDRLHSERREGPGARVIDWWLDRRLRFDVLMQEARGSIAQTARAALQSGIPIVAILVAVNPIWGFSWYFNTENWASGFWQEITAARVEVWQRAIGEAAAADAGGQVGDPDLFALAPEGVAEGDFSFIVIGDTGEGDSSQLILKDRILDVARRPEMRFLVVSSDVIYPSGDMFDYEAKFYLPFKGVAQPIYAIPGNHDWFNGLDAFAANFFEPAAAGRAIRARVDADHHLSSTTDDRAEQLIDEARRLRTAYGIRNGRQSAPWFEIRTGDFSLIAADTGILRKLDEFQLRWFRAALERSKDRFTMVLLGHPPYVAGRFQAADPDFGAVVALLREYRVPLVMAGDTHEFEYYRVADGAGGAGHYVVNGGGGAYLSIGTALDFPAEPDTPDWAFYPSTAAVADKLEAQTPAWKWPIWWWIKRFNGWPVTPEWLSAVFDFNDAPSFQSFVEVRVERGAGRVRMIVHGVDGPLRWRQMQRGGALPPPGTGSGDPVELVLPLRAR